MGETNCKKDGPLARCFQKESQRSFNGSKLPETLARNLRPKAFSRHLEDGNSDAQAEAKPEGQGKGLGIFCGNLISEKETPQNLPVSDCRDG